MKQCLVVSGGPLEPEFAAEFVNKRTFDYVIAVDNGLMVCEAIGLRPDIAVGDFDTFGKERMEALRERAGWDVEVHRPEKDETDTELAFRAAIKAGCVKGVVLGATGGRLDHELSNIHLLFQAKRRGLSMEIFDRRNRIFLLEARDGKQTFRRETAYGTYVSFLPLSETVEGITLEGFRYPLHKKNISILENPSLCVSNELLEPEASMVFEKGVLICVESKD